MIELLSAPRSLLSKCNVIIPQPMRMYSDTSYSVNYWITMPKRDEDEGEAGEGVVTKNPIGVSL